MLSLELSINIVALLALMTTSGLAGFVLRRWHISKIRAKLGRVENEIIRSHREILDLQKECVSLEEQLCSRRNPVIAMGASPQKKNDKKLPNAALRKKILKNALRIAHDFN